MGADLILFILGQMGLMLLYISLIGVGMAAFAAIWLSAWEAINGL